MFYARRNPDHSQKKQIMDSAAVMADVMLKHLKQEVPSMRHSFFVEYEKLIHLQVISPHPTHIIASCLA
jgi:E3 ubiquitin-protein ligase HUWE1